MAQQVSFFQEGVDRVRDAMDSIEGEIEKVQKDLRARRRRVEKRLDSGRRDLEKRARRLGRELRKNGTVKQVESLRKRATDQIEERVDDVLSALQIASKSDLQRMNRKIGQLNRRIRELDGNKSRARKRA